MDTQFMDNVKNEKKRSKGGRFISYLAIALVASLIGGLISPYILSNYVYGNNLTGDSETTQSYDTEKTYSINSDTSSIVSVAAKKSMSSVVGITTVKVQRYGFMEQEVDGVGSGVIVDSNGYILTNSHVIGDGKAKEITVLFEDGGEKPGKVLWYDPTLDLAMVKVDANGLPVATLGDSDKLEVGEIAIAIGNPLGLEFERTVTSGIISGLHRTIKIDESNIIEDLIQTDASINPGNSGGPLLNGKGEVVGINTAKITTAEGLGFSIPINIVKPIIDQVIKKGTYETVFIGITGVEVELYERQLRVDLSADEGVIIIEVVSNSPASKAGLINGDIITKIDDQQIKNMNQLKKALYKYEKGDKAKLSIIRNGKEKQVEIVFSDLR
ncbi:MAG: PDZ domain-containing protein [Tissierellia bacterium]|nr:PDZ domain-containing protein [Tissierellia bacterium]